MNGGGSEGQRRADLGSGWERHDSVPRGAPQARCLDQTGEKVICGYRPEAKPEGKRKERQRGAVPPVLAAAGQWALRRNALHASYSSLSHTADSSFSFDVLTFRKISDFPSRQMVDQ